MDFKVGKEFVDELVLSLKSIGLNMEYFPADDDCVQIWQHDGFEDKRSLYISITWNIARVDIEIDKDDDSYSFGGLLPSCEREEIEEIIKLLGDL